MDTIPHRKGVRLSLLYWKPKLTSAHLCYDSFNYDEKKAYYSITFCIEECPSDWDFRETLFNELKDIDLDEMKEWFNRKLKTMKEKK